MEIKRLKDEIEISIESRNVSYSPKYSNIKADQTQKASITNNASIMKSM